MTRRKRLNAVLELPGSLRVESAALGLTFESQIASEKVSLTLPVETPGRFGAPGVGDHTLPTVLTDRIPIWGFQSSPGEFTVRAVRMSFLGTPTKSADPFDYPEVEAIAHAVFDWFTIVNEWLSAWLRYPSQLPDHDRGTTVHLLRSDGSPTGFGGQQQMTVIAGAAVATPEQLVGAFRRAAKGLRVPIEYEMLLASRNALFGDDHRRCVIDAGTAAEIAMATAIRDAAKSGPATESFVEQAIKNANGLVELVDLYESLGAELTLSKARVMDRLANVRNEAAHQGVVPTRDRARDAFQVAQQIVDECRPIEATG